MSNIEYNYLLFEISQRVVELNVQEQLVFMCRDLAECSADNIQSVQDVLSLFKLLEERNHLGPDCLVVMKDLLKVLREWSLFGKVKKLESKRKEYVDFLEQIIRVLDELDDLERLMSICRGKIPEESTTNIHDVRSLFQVLENHSYLRIDRLEILREILIEYDKEDMLKEVDNFEKRQCDDEEFERRTAQAAAVVSCVRNASERIIGEVKVHCTFRKIGGALLVVGTGLILRKCSSLEQFIQAFTVATLPAANALRAISEGSVCFTVQVETMSALEVLWQRYRDGTLQKDLQEFLVTEEIRQLADGEEVLVAVYIDESEFKNALADTTNVKERVFVFPDGREEERPMKMHRRNSDSNLYCKALDGEMPKERTFQLEKPATRRAKYLDQERLAFVQSYLDNFEGAGSMTTETSDSGMPGTLGAPSELGMEEEGSTDKLCLKDLNNILFEKLTYRLARDSISHNRFYQSLGLDPVKMENPRVRRNIREFFADTPIKLLKDVFEALQLHDLVELLEEAKPGTLRPALPLIEIGKLTNASNRPITYYSKARVLIIDYRSSGHGDAERFGSFFKALNSWSEIATITAMPLFEVSKILKEMKQLKITMEHRVRYHELCLTERESQMKMEEVVEERKQWAKEGKQKMEKEIKEKKEELQREKDKILVDFLTTLNKWAHEEDKESTLFVVFEIRDFSSQGIKGTVETVARNLTEKLALIPDCTKLLITSQHNEKVGKISNTLHLMYSGLKEDFVATVVEIFSKRWQTMDLISMVQEVQRSSMFTCTISDSLSSLPKLQKMEEKLQIK